MTSKQRSIGYWAATSLAAAAFLAGGAFDLAHGAQADAAMVHLGYPVYVGTILGVWKLLGALAILAPRLPRLKEWAYAGMLFDLTGAAASHASVGDPLAEVVTPLVILAIVLASWALRPAGRVLTRAVPAQDDQPTTQAPALRAA